MILGRFRTTITVVYSDAVIPRGTTLQAHDPQVVPGYDGQGIRRQVKASRGDRALGIPADPIVVVNWDGRYRTIPLRLLEAVE